MRTNLTLVILATALSPALFPNSAWSQARPTTKTEARSTKAFKLRPGPVGKLCRDCHTDFEEVAKRPWLHTPVKKGDCTGCHSPHASDHGKLLSTEVKDVCGTCHQIVPKEPLSEHKVIASEGCTKCHDVHGSNNKFNLVKPMEELCGTCHGELVAAAKASSQPHRPLQKDGCTACHNPHGSGEEQNLLKKKTSELCLGCHRSNTARFKDRHVGFSVEQARCTGCHNPHGSNQKGMLYDGVHSPVAKRMCTQCHEPPEASGEVKLKRQGRELCRGCHSSTLASILEKGEPHWPVYAGAACLNCHSPHAASGPKLLKGGTLEVCGRCHQDTLDRQATSKTKHPPIAEGKCGKCHDPHSSKNPILFAKASALDLCGECHGWEKHTSHPIGLDKKDPRNPSLSLDCLSCHRAHGTQYEHLFPTPSQLQLCTQCHTKYRR